ncbi:MAG: DUF721 domain-containing protein [Candidatus Poribacteria bacterium]|nr:DUF721 domain-containing protein [Candidatus Poribacteria bacterium]MDE0506937.1 DUF721 domain-containing protein [Candidatus Poribacteria bacterium]
MKPDSAGKTHELGPLLETVLKEHGFEHKMVEQRVFDAWKRAVGEPIARNTEPTSLVKSKLTVYAFSHPLVAELTLLREHIIRKLNAAVGRVAVGELRFQMMPARSLPRQESQHSRRFRRHNILEDDLGETEVSAGVLEKVEHAVAGVPDRELKTNLRRLFLSRSRRTVIDDVNHRI